MPPPPPSHSSSTPAHSSQQHRLRSLRGCWTCRLRRKKCDETRPVCTTCSTLEVTCHYGEAKPTWMDGGRREKEKTAEIKVMIKARAGERRERKWAVFLDPPQTEQNHDDVGREAEYSRVEDTTTEDPSGPLSVNPNTEAVARTGGPSSSSSPYNTTNHGQHEERRQTTAIPDDNPSHSTAAAQLPSPESQTRSPRWLDEVPAAVRTTLLSSSHGVDDVELERETNNIMIYLDHVVPFFYPFYRPPLISGSRGWQLYLLFRDRTIFHTALSLAAYFLAVVFHTTRDQPALRPETHTACQGAAWADLVKHQELAIRTLQADVARLSGESSLRESIRGLQGIVQLLEFDMAIARRPDVDGTGTKSGESSSSSWLPHLNAALELFNQILERQRRHDEHSAHVSIMPSFEPSQSIKQRQKHPWYSITHQLSHFSSASIPPPRLNFKPPLSNSESALHFYTARLLYVDIIAGTTLNRVPLLEPHHAALLQSDDDNLHNHSHDHDQCEQGEDGNDNSRSGPAIHLAEHIGIQNWALFATARATALSVWKAQMRSQGTLSVVELVRRAGVIEADIRAGIAGLAPSLDGGLAQGGGGSGGGAKTFLFDPSDFSAGQYHAPRPITTFTSSSSSSSSSSTAAVPAVIALHTTIHARATLIYLSSATSGLQPSLPEIQTELSHVLDLIRLLPSASCLRTLLWAFTVAGCVAVTPEQRALFEDAVDTGMGDMGVFGGVRESLAVLRAVWGVGDCGALHGCSGGGSEMIGGLGDWSLAGCLNILGHPSLPA